MASEMGCASLSGAAGCNNSRCCAYGDGEEPTFRDYSGRSSPRGPDSGGRVRKAPVDHEFSESESAIGESRGKTRDATRLAGGPHRLEIANSADADSDSRLCCAHLDDRSHDRTSGPVTLWSASSKGALAGGGDRRDNCRFARS